MVDHRCPTVPTISVVIPAHNAEATLASQLRALSEQAVSVPWELVVVDNRSSDRTVGVALEWSERFECLDIVSATSKAGAGYARNVGTKSARGEVVLLCDADDVVGRDWIQNMWEALSDRGCDIVGGYCETGTLNSRNQRFWLGELPRDQLPCGWFPVAISANMGYRREVFSKIGGFDESFPQAEDDDFSYRAHLAGFRVGFAPEARVHYRYRATIREVARQHYRYAQCHARLYRKHQQLGHPRRPLRKYLATLAWLAVHCPDLLRGLRYRGRWVRVGAAALGRLVGAWRARVFYF